MMWNSVLELTGQDESGIKGRTESADDSPCGVVTRVFSE